MTVAAYEEGKLSFETYLKRVLFSQDRPFSRAEFRDYMCAQSTPFPEMIAMLSRLKSRHGLKIAAVSNEGRELNAYRIHKFQLSQFVDCFISSCFVHLRKPDEDIFRLALDVMQTPASQIVYIENTAMFVQIAQSLGIRSILHTDYPSTRAELESLGLNCEVEAVGQK